MATKDQFESPDYYLIDDLLTEEHLLIRNTIRDFVKREISPIIEEVCQSCIFPKDILPKLASLGCFGPFIPTEHGGAGLDQIFQPRDHPNGLPNRPVRLDTPTPCRGQ